MKKIMLTIIILLVLIGCTKEAIKTQDTTETITDQEINDLNLDELSTEDLDTLESEIDALE